MSYEGSEIGIGIASDFASVLTLSGVNSEHPPKLVIQQGKAVELTYTSESGACGGVEVTIEGVGATEYPATAFVTDENGKIRINLTEGEYRATTEAGNYEASSNTFTVSNSDVSESYTLTVNTSQPDPTAPPVHEDGVYTFGDSYNEVKTFNTSPLSETAIGDTGFRISIDTSAVVRDKASTDNGYYPYREGLPERGYYLFLGAGGNNPVVSAELTLPLTVNEGKYIKITYAKPKATNNGSNERTAANSTNTVTVGGETIDLKNNYEFDTWYTTTIKADADISSISFRLGSWSAVAVSSIEITDDADTLELTSEVSEMYITPGEQTVQYTATVYNSITTLADSEEIILRGSADENAAVAYSVNGYEGVSIDANGLLTITGAAEPGEIQVTVSYGGHSKDKRRCGYEL